MFLFLTGIILTVTIYYEISKYSSFEPRNVSNVLLCWSRGAQPSSAAASSLHVGYGWGGVAPRLDCGLP